MAKSLCVCVFLPSELKIRHTVYSDFDLTLSAVMTRGKFICTQFAYFLILRGYFLQTTYKRFTKSLPNDLARIYNFQSRTKINSSNSNGAPNCILQKYSRCSLHGTQRELRRHNFTTRNLPLLHTCLAMLLSQPKWREPNSRKQKLFSSPVLYLSKRKTLQAQPLPKDFPVVTHVASDWFRKRESIEYLVGGGKREPEWKQSKVSLYATEHVCHFFLLCPCFIFCLPLCPSDYINHR